MRSLAAFPQEALLRPAQEAQSVWEASLERAVLSEQAVREAPLALVFLFLWEALWASPVPASVSTGFADSAGWLGDSRFGASVGSDCLGDSVCFRGFRFSWLDRFRCLARLRHLR